MDGLTLILVFGFGAVVGAFGYKEFEEMRAKDKKAKEEKAYFEKHKDEIKAYLEKKG